MLECGLQIVRISNNMNKPQTTSPLHLLSTLKRFVYGVIERDIGKQHVSMLHGQILRFVAEQKSVTMKDLARHLSITPPSATSLVECLVKKGWLARVTDKKDRRVVRICVTQSGRKMMRRVRKSIEQAWEDVLKTMTASQKKHLEEFTEHLIHYMSSL